VVRIVGVSAVSQHLLLAALVLLAACGRAPPPEPVLKIASQKGGTRSLILAAHALDGAPYRVEWSEFPSAQTLLEALRAGAIDAGAVGDAPFMFAYASGIPAKAIAASHAGGASTAVLVRADSPIRTPADLKGRRIATGRGSIGHYLLLKLLEGAGLGPKDVTIVFLSPADSKAAFASGAVDAWSTWGPYVGQAELHDNARTLADGQGLLTGLGFEAASTSAIASKRLLLADFVRRLAIAQHWEASHEADYAKVLAGETGLAPDVALFTVRKMRSTPTPIDSAVLTEERAALAEYAKAGVIARAPTVEGAFDASFDQAR